MKNPQISKSFYRTSIAVMLSVGSAMGAASAAHAQAAGESVAESGGLDEIVVTAQKRTERLQDVPISASVTGGAELQRKSLNNALALSEQNPSLQIVAQGRSNRIYLRGIGSGETQSFDQSVTTFIDNVYHGRSRLSSGTFLDLDRIEVLKGPQSTFFGNNAIAGAINIQTKKPGKEFGGYARALASPSSDENGGQYVLEGAVTVPLSDALRVRVAGIVNGQKGFAKNVVTGKRAPKEDNRAGRITALFEPNDSFDASIKGELTSNSAKPGLVGRHVDCPSAFGPTQNGPLCGTALANGLPIGLKTSKVSILPGGIKKLETQDTSLDLNFHFDAGTLSSVTAFHAYQFKFNLDNGLTNVKLLNVQAPEKYHQFSQELRFASNTDGPFEYLVGAYAQTSKLNIDQGVTYYLLTGAFAGSPLAPFTPLGQKIESEVREDLYSAFGSLTYNATDKLKLSAGLRGSIVKKGFDWLLFYGQATADYGGIVRAPQISGQGFNPGFGTAGTIPTQHRTDKALMPSARLQYQISPRVMAYASYSRGFKAGGFSVADTSAVAANYGFDPEHVNAYEIGLKSELFDRTVLLNLAAFRSDYSDLQVALAINTGGGFQNFVRNAAKSRSQGVEIAAQWLVTPWYRLKAEATYLDSKYLVYPGGETTLDQKLAGLAVQDLAGHRTLFAPDWSGNVTGTLTLPVSDSLQFVAEGNAIFTTEYQTYPSDDFRTEQPGYVKFDLRLSLEAQDGRWGIDLIGKNLNNRIIRTVSAYEPLAFGPLIQDRKQLRNIALQLRYNF